MANRDDEPPGPRDSETITAPTSSASAHRRAASRRCSSSSSTCRRTAAPPTSSSSICRRITRASSRGAAACGADPGHAGDRQAARAESRLRDSAEQEAAIDGDASSSRTSPDGGAARAGRHLLPLARRRAGPAPSASSCPAPDERIDGLKRVKEYGGLSIAQEPAEAEVRRHAAQRDRHRAGRPRAAGRRDAGAIREFHRAAARRRPRAERPPALARMPTRCARS